MARIDASIYQNQAVPQIFGAIQEGRETATKMSELAKQRADQDKKMAWEAKQQEQAQRKFHQEQAAPVIMSMTPENYESTYAQLKKLGNPAADDLPPVYDPKLVSAYQASAMPVAQQLQQRQYAQDMELKGYTKGQDGKWSIAKGGAADIANQQAQANLGKTRAEIAALGAKSTGLAGGKSEGIKTLDKEFAKDYNDWTNGGSQSAQLEIEKLKSVADSLRDKKLQTGGMTGMFPDRMTSNNVLKARSDVQSTVMNSMRAILGAAFTEKEGDRVIKNTWNEADSTENNLARLDRLVNQLQSQAAAKNAKSQYFQANNSLNGFDESLKAPQTQRMAAPQSHPQDNQAIEWAKANPSDPRSAQILRANGISVQAGGR